MMKYLSKVLSVAAVLMAVSLNAGAQKYANGLVDKAAAVVGNELITISDIEGEVQMMRAQGMSSDRNMRCEILENIMQSKIFLMQARIDSLKVNQDAVQAQLNNRIDEVRRALGGDEQLEEYFGKPTYRLRRDWQKQLEEMSLMQQEQAEIAGKIPEITPYDVKKYIEECDPEDLPIIPAKYKMSQICIYPDREAGANAVKERLLSLRERVINGERFATLARLYSEDTNSARRGGELGMAPKSSYWTSFSDAAMSLRPGVISQIVETPDGFHIIEVIEKKGDMFNARHILMRPQYTAEDKEAGFAKLDSIKVMIDTSGLTFEMAAMYFSQDLATRTNGGQMSDPNTGSAYFEIDQLKPQDYAAVQDLEEGQISDPIESLDNEGRSGNLVYKIIRLDKIVPAHTATFESDYTELLSGVQNMKQQEAVNDFLDEKIKSTYIMIDPLFEDCNFSREGWAEKFRKD